MPFLARRDPRSHFAHRPDQPLGGQDSDRLAIRCARHVQAAASLDLAIENIPGLESAGNYLHADFARDRRGNAQRLASRAGGGSGGRSLDIHLSLLVASDRGTTDRPRRAPHDYVRHCGVSRASRPRRRPVSAGTAPLHRGPPIRRRTAVGARLRRPGRRSGWRGWPRLLARRAEVRLRNLTRGCREVLLRDLTRRRVQALLGGSLALGGHVPPRGSTLRSGLRRLSCSPRRTVAPRRTREPHRHCRRVRPHSRQLCRGQRPPAIGADGRLLGRERHGRARRRESRHYRTHGNRARWCLDAHARIHAKNALPPGRDGRRRGCRPQARHALLRQRHAMRVHGQRGSKHIARHDGHGTRHLAVDKTSIGGAGPIPVSRTERQPANTGPAAETPTPGPPTHATSAGA